MKGAGVANDPGSCWCPFLISVGPAHREGVAHAKADAAERRSNSIEGGRALRILTVPDEYARECLAIEVERRWSS